MNDLRNERIFITGGAGFVGSYIVEQLLDEGVSEIIILDNMIRGSCANIKGPLDTGKVKLIEGDIRDQGLLNECIKDCHYCFHLAALRITHCASEPREALEIMYEGTFNVLQACVEAKIKKLVFASSASVYGQADSFPTKEDHHPYNNFTLYGAAKAANELMLQSFTKMYGLNYNALRFFNIYGPRMDTHGKYTEVFIRWYYLIKEGKEPLIFGEGDQTMDFIYIAEIARASILALKADINNEVFNIASGRETSLKELCALLLKSMDARLGPKYVSLPKERENVEVSRRLAEVSKAKELLGFESKVSLEEGLKRLISWLDQQQKVLNAV